jgi:hypothetical protein
MPKVESFGLFDWDVEYKNYVKGENARNGWANYFVVW